MAIKISGTDVIDNNRKGIFNSTNIGSFTPANRPGSAATGDIIYNSTNTQMEVWNGSSWVRACGISSIVATGGNVTGVSTTGLNFHIFTSPGSFVLPAPAKISYIVIGGGGGGGNNGGGGGAGGLQYRANTQVSSGTYTITVGAGGAAGPSGTNGSNSSISTIATATGGGKGGNPGSDGSNGGSGGGGGIGGPRTSAGIPPTTNFTYSEGGFGVNGQGHPGAWGGTFPGYNTPFAGAGGGAGSNGGSNRYIGVINQSQWGGRGIVLLSDQLGFPTSYGQSVGISTEGEYITSGNPTFATLAAPHTIESLKPRLFASGGGGSPFPAPAPTSPFYTPQGANTGNGGNGTSPAEAGSSGIVIITYNTYQG